MSDPVVPPDFVPSNNQSIDNTTGIVTEKETGIQMSIDAYAAAMVKADKAHNINEALVMMGQPQRPNLPAAPDGSGKPTFTVPAPAPQPVPSAAPVVPPIPHPSAPPEHHASFWRGILALLGQAAEDPVILALIPAPERGAVQIAGAVVQIVANPNASPASLGQS